MKPPDWPSYDSIAVTYDEIAAPHYFQGPAESLVAALQISTADRVLDLGSGTGLVAAAALRRTSSVTAADVSCSMLSRAPRRGVERRIACALPVLAFPDRSFECLAASFLLNHIPDLCAALREIDRVLCPGGRFGATSWAQGPSENEIGDAWGAIAGEFVDRSAVAVQVGQALPGEERLKTLDAIREILSSSGFSVLSLQELEFPISIPTADWIRSRSVALTARFMRSVLPSAEWDRFERTVRGRLIAGFGSCLDFSVRVNVAVAETS